MFRNTLIDMAALTKRKRKYKDFEADQATASTRVSAIETKCQALVENVKTAKAKIEHLNGQLKAMEASIQKYDGEKKALKDSVAKLEQRKEKYIVDVVTKCVVKYQSLLDRMD